MDEARHILLKDGKLVEDTADSILKKLLRLVQVASNPSVIDKNYSQHPGKFEELVRLLTINRDKGIVTLTHLITYIAYMMVRGGAPND